MTRPLSEDLRVRAVAAFRAGGTCREVGTQFDIAPSSVVKWAGLETKTGSLAPGKMGGRRSILLAPHRDFILTCIEQTPHLTMKKLKVLLAERGVNVCCDTIWRFMRKEDLSFKKNSSRD
jgi:transposase